MLMCRNFLQYAPKVLLRDCVVVEEGHNGGRHNARNEHRGGPHQPKSLQARMMPDAQEPSHLLLVPCNLAQSLINIGLL